jgi:uncharacterized protein YecE (DUF72 family)
MKHKAPKITGLNIGTSGWSYQHWKSIFYPETIKPSKYLEYYITQFDCVELNSSFYHLPKEKTIDGWINRTPSYFRFCPKISRFITHRKRLFEADEPLENFFRVFSSMKDKMGPVLVQLPPGLKYDEPRIVYFLEVLKQKYSGFRFAFEIRDKSWIRDKFFALLTSYQMAFVIADSGNRYPYSETVTSDLVYLRLHGNEQLYATDYKMEELRGIAIKTKNWLNQNKQVWIFFNNDYHGYAVKNAKELIDIIVQM